MSLDLTGVITIEQQARELAIVTDERLKLATLTLADWKEPMDKANEDLQLLKDCLPSHANAGAEGTECHLCGLIVYKVCVWLCLL